MKGLANFYLDRGLLNRIFPRDRASRDMQAGKDAFSAFRELVNKFPDSEYAPDPRTNCMRRATMPGGARISRPPTGRGTSSCIISARRRSPKHWPS